MEERLSEHFTLQEFIRSETATKHGLCNNPPLFVITNLQNLCQEVLEPLRKHMGEPIYISSGYRCKELNKLVGGVRNSLHLTGNAADIQVRGNQQGLRLNVLTQMAQWIKSHCNCKEVIIESRGKVRWVHVGRKDPLTPIPSPP